MFPQDEGRNNTRDCFVPLFRLACFAGRKSVPGCCYDGSSNPLLKTMTPETPPHKPSESVAILGYALAGAAVTILIVVTMEWLETGTVSEESPSSGDENRGCPLTASPEACDACMLASCLTSCRACANNPACLRLFTCVMDCPDVGCEADCARSHPEGREDLAAFLGQEGCLVRRCSVVCQ